MSDVWQPLSAPLLQSEAKEKCSEPKEKKDEDLKWVAETRKKVFTRFFNTQYFFKQNIEFPLWKFWIFWVSKRITAQPRWNVPTPENPAPVRVHSACTLPRTWASSGTNVRYTFEQSKSVGQAIIVYNYFLREFGLLKLSTFKKKYNIKGPTLWSQISESGTHCYHIIRIIILGQMAIFQTATGCCLNAVMLYDVMIFFFQNHYWKTEF